MPRIAIFVCKALMRSAHRYVGFSLKASDTPAVMKNRIASIGLVMCVFFCHASAMRAQLPGAALPSKAPVLPMDIKFKQVPQYFEQSFTDDPNYARIEALVDEDQYDIILLNKTTNREVLYSNVNRRVDALAAQGVDAYTTSIDFEASLADHSHPLFLIHFHDRFGQEVTWRFAPGEMVPHASPGVIVYTHSGVTVLYAPRRAPAVAGTILRIAGRTYRPESTPSHDSLAGFYATDMTIGAILPGTELWNIESSPDLVVQPAKWTLSGRGGQQRILAVNQLSDTEAAVHQIDPNNPDASHVVFNVVRVNGAYGVSSVSVESRGNRLWIFFGPVLPLAARQTDKTTVTFTVAENEQAIVASGEIEVERTIDVEHLLWRFKKPYSASGAVFVTGVNLIPGALEQAKCVNERCSDLR
jgi:hypothetical protein